jgi:hypothetical protein
VLTKSARSGIPVSGSTYYIPLVASTAAYPPYHDFAHELIYEGSIHDMDRLNARRTHNEQKAQALFDATPQKRRKMKQKQQRRAYALYGE